jgi:hypothetical protein
MACSKYGTKL